MGNSDGKLPPINREWFPVPIDPTLTLLPWLAGGARLPVWLLVLSMTRWQAEWSGWTLAQLEGRLKRSKRQIRRALEELSRPRSRAPHHQFIRLKLTKSPRGGNWLEVLDWLRTDEIRSGVQTELPASIRGTQDISALSTQDISALCSALARTDTGQTVPMTQDIPALRHRDEMSSVVSGNPSFYRRFAALQISGRLRRSEEIPVGEVENEREVSSNPPVLYRPSEGNGPGPRPGPRPGTGAERPPEERSAIHAGRVDPTGFKPIGWTPPAGASREDVAASALEYLREQIRRKRRQP